jgi:hypothetical protein
MRQEIGAETRSPVGFVAERDVGFFVVAQGPGPVSGINASLIKVASSRPSRRVGQTA